MYAFATVPVINNLKAHMNPVWYADDAAATWNIVNLQTWCDEIAEHGPGYGFYANGSKTQIVVKEKFNSQAEAAFADTEVKVTCEGRPHLGVQLGTDDYISKYRYVSEKLLQWSQELTLLTAIAIT